MTNEHIIIAATNRKDMIDDALLRRFSKKHEIKIFSVEEKIEMVSKYLKAINFDHFINNLEKFCAEKSSLPQSEIINLIKEKIADCIINKKTVLEL